MNFWRRASGLIEVELTCAEPGFALDYICGNSISLYHVKHIDSLTVRFQIHRTDYPFLEKMAMRRGEQLKRYGQQGVFWYFRKLKKRKTLVTGLLLLLLLIYFIPTRVLFVRVEGNDRVSDRKILEASEACGIGFFSSRRNVRSEKIKNELLSRLPELQWAGVNTRGCVAVIKVRERTAQEEPKSEAAISSIVASTDGIIDSCTVVQGNLLCQPGQAVRTGEVLISGYTDCGLFLQATKAEGEIYAWTKRQLTAVTPLQSRKIYEEGQTKYKISLLIGKKRINLWKDSGIWDSSCGRMYSEYYVTLPGGFALPIALSVERYTAREMTDFLEQETNTALSEFAHQYLAMRMIAGEIRSSKLSFSENAGIARLTGSYLCYEMIGRVQPEQIGE